MKTNIILIIITNIFLLSFKQPFQENQIDVKKYVGFKIIDKKNHYGKIKKYASIYLINQNNTISDSIEKHKGRFKYLIVNKINKDSINYYKIKDTIKARYFFNKEINKALFKNNFNKLLQPNPKVSFSKKELMLVASKYFYLQKHNDRYGVKICIGRNGSKELDKKKDYTLLEAIVFDAIFENLLKNEDTTKFNILDLVHPKKVSKFLKKSITKMETNKTLDTILYLRNRFYRYIEKKKKLEKYLTEYINKNEKYIPIKLEK